jgi:hypothetical protein
VAIRLAAGSCNSGRASEYPWPSRKSHNRCPGAKVGRDLYVEQSHPARGRKECAEDVPWRLE